ncbi:MAG: DUF4430 domain-containing protein [Planctomycetota bacterium]
MAEKSTGHGAGDEGSPPGNEPELMPVRWYAPLVLVVVFAALLVSQLFLRREAPGAAKPAAAPATGKTVSLVIDPGAGPDAKQRFAMPWTEGLTALGVLERASPVKRTGEGDQAFVHTVGGVKNEGPGGRSWLYSVNGERGQVSAGVRTLTPDDRVLWEFAVYD